MSKFKVDPAAIRELAELLNETGLTEIELEDNGKRLRVSRGAPAAVAAAPAAPVAAPAPAPAAPAPAATETASEADLKDHPGTLTSPMVGTAYLAPEPGAAPFVREGDTVSAGQTVVIVEAMKTMNPITAHKDGKVTKILVANEQPVEFGEPLMVIE